MLVWNKQLRKCKRTSYGDGVKKEGKKIA